MPFSEQAYSARLRELFKKFPSVQTRGFTQNAYKPGLEGMLRFDAALGSPWKSYPCIHVAGTNGKGSVSSMIAASLASDGLKVGLYTSPHLSDFRERMKVVSEAGTRLVSREEVWDFLEEYESFTEGLSFFEITTGMALRWFSACRVDCAVIEVGLGGRLDSTNIITPVLSVVTSIGLDHCALLGNSRAAIAAEKAGIFKKNVPALVGFTDAETEPVFREKAEETGCPLTLLPAVSIAAGESFQKMNRATACAALEMTGHRPNQAAIERMAELTGLHGRWETLSLNPELVADIGHNPQALALNFARLENTGRPLMIVYGVMADKDLDTIASYMPSGARYFLCAPATERALPVQLLFSRLKALRPDLDIRPFDSVASAVESAISYAGQIANSLIYVGGSNFVVSELFEIPRFKTTEN